MSKKISTMEAKAVDLISLRLLLLSFLLTVLYIKVHEDLGLSRLGDGVGLILLKLFEIELSELYFGYILILVQGGIVF